ncbi:MAG: hypothetical protein IT430_18290 [Phycisphaerales bacterium]|nr:hypothetical protein [Phycisphaerales bacterium]
MTPTRARLLGLVLLLLWGGAMYLTWVRPRSIDDFSQLSLTSHRLQIESYGITGWLTYHREEEQSRSGGMARVVDEATTIQPAATALAALITAVVSAILYLGYREAVGRVVPVAIS